MQPRPQMTVPDSLRHVLFGHAAFQYLSAGSELGLFDLLYSEQGIPESAIAKKLELSPRSARGLLLGCSSLGLIHRVPDSGYVLGEDLLSVFRAGWWKELADTIRFENEIVYRAQGRLAESLRKGTNVGLNEIPGSSPDLYTRFAEDQRLKEVFFKYMKSWSVIAGHGLVDAFPDEGVTRVLDVGGGDGVNSILLAQAYPHLRITMTDLKPACELATRAVAEAGLTDRIRIEESDMFLDPFPDGNDCIVFVHQMVIWDAGQCTELLRKALASLPRGGRVVIYNSVTDDLGDGPFVAAMDNAYFLTLPSKGGYIHSWSDYRRYLESAGFTRVECRKPNGWTPHGLIVAFRP